MTDKTDNSDEDVFEDDEDEMVSDSAAGAWLELPPAGLLSIIEADELLRWRDAHVVAVVGERNGGKTTLISEIYDQYLRGPFADHEFCHSRSLLGFEQRSFQARASSGAALPDTPRTSARDGLKFFHLGVVGAANGVRSDLLISERAGESYRELRDTPAKAIDLIELAKAQTIVLTLDGARVADAKQRAEAFASVRNITRAITNESRLQVGVEFQLVTTKFDLLGGETAETARSSLVEFEAVFQNAVAEKAIKSRVFRTAARDPTGKVEPAWGLTELFGSWTRRREQVVLVPRLPPALDDQFDRLALTRSPV